jgi:phosphoglycerate dehydrogenase-like enzyme
VIDDDGVQVVGPQEMHAVLGRADYVVVVVPLTDQTRNLIDASAIAAIKPGAVFINVARGGIVDEDALRTALRSGALAGAALDVFDDEPLPPDSTWWTEPNVFVTPHVSGLAPRYFGQVLEIVSTNLRRFVSGQPLLNRVDRERGY